MYGKKHVWSVAGLREKKSDSLLPASNTVQVVLLNTKCINQSFEQKLEFPCSLNLTHGEQLLVLFIMRTSSINLLVQCF